MNEVELLRAFRPWLRVVGARMAAAPSQAEDFAQEGWIAIWRALPDYDGQRPFDPWAKSVAINRMHNLIRDGHAALRDVRREATVGDVIELVDLGKEVEGLELAYHAGQIQAAINRLTPLQREYVLARFWGGLNYQELNERFSSRNSTAAFWKRAKANLARELEHLAVA